MQDHQGLFLAKGTTTGEAPLLRNFNKKLQKGSWYSYNSPDRSYHVELKICCVVDRRLPSHTDDHDDSNDENVMVPFKKGGKWEKIPQKLYLRKLKKNERNDLASLQEWCTLVQNAISEQEKDSSPPLKMRFHSDITLVEDFDGDEILPSLDSILCDTDVVKCVLKRYYSKFISNPPIGTKRGPNSFFLKQTWQKYFSDDDVDVVKSKFDGMELSRELDDKTGACVAIRLYERRKYISWVLISFISSQQASKVHSPI